MIEDVPSIRTWCHSDLNDTVDKWFVVSDSSKGFICRYIWFVINFAENMRIIEALTKFKSLSEIKVTKVEKKFTKAEIDNSGYESYVNSSTDDDINVCKKFLEITEDLIKKRGVSPSQIPNIFFKCGEEATKLFCSTNCSQKNIPKETNGAKKNIQIKKTEVSK